MHPIRTIKDIEVVEGSMLVVPSSEDSFPSAVADVKSLRETCSDRRGDLEEERDEASSCPELCRVLQGRTS